MEAERFKLLRLQNQYLLIPNPANEVVSGLQAQYGANALYA